MNVAENAVNTHLVRNSEIWLMDSESENARRVVPGDNLTYFGSVRWSPDGNRIAFQKLHKAENLLIEYSIETCNLDGKACSVLVRKRNYSGQSMDHNFPEDFCWLRDGRIVHAVRKAPPNNRDANLWAF